MFIGWENALGWAFREGKNFKKLTQQKSDDHKVLNSILTQLNK